MSEIADQLRGFHSPVDTIVHDLPLVEDIEYMTDEEYDSDDSLDHELALINAQLQWEESLSQLKLLLNIVILPILGKALGRRLAGFRKYHLNLNPT